MSLSNRYQSQQIEIHEKIAVAVPDAQLEKQTYHHANAKQLRAVISHYLNIVTLASLIMNKLIEKIQVG